VKWQGERRIVTGDVPGDVRMIQFDKNGDADNDDG
jgi:hypothetical protein